MYKKLYEKINYSFKNENILDLVFTHKSSGEKNNERLEFLGDAVLGAVTVSYTHLTLPTTLTV